MPRRPSPTSGTVPRSIPGEWFNTLFAALRLNRDVAMIALWISSGVRALLKMDPGPTPEPN